MTGDRWMNQRERDALSLENGPSVFSRFWYLEELCRWAARGRRGAANATEAVHKRAAEILGFHGAEAARPEGAPT